MIGPCHTCVHTDLPGSSEPCRSCSVLWPERSGASNAWASAEPVSEAPFTSNHEWGSTPPKDVLPESADTTPRRNASPFPSLDETGAKIGAIHAAAAQDLSIRSCCSSVEGGSHNGWCQTSTDNCPEGYEGPRITVDITQPRSSNPKKAMGMAKPPLHLVPSTGIVAMAMAFKDGARKYGDYNWRIDPVDVSTYVAAAERHLKLFWDGQDIVSDNPDNILNLGAVMACCAILIDAQHQGTLIDDRPPSVAVEDMMDRWTVGRGLPAPIEPTHH